MGGHAASAWRAQPSASAWRSKTAVGVHQWFLDVGADLGAQLLHQDNADAVAATAIMMEQWVRYSLGDVEAFKKGYDKVVCMHGAFNNSKLYNYRCKLSSGHRLFRGFGLQNLV